MDIEDYSTHGVFVVVNHQGILLQGKPGVGKSDLALNLLDKGHALVVDDLVLFRRDGDCLIGYGNTDSYGKIHIRNLGMLNLANKYTIIEEYQLDKIIWLSDEKTVDSALPTLECASVLGQNIPLFRLTIGTNRPLVVLVESIADIKCQI
ncbi:hypothetical protein L3V82_02835 [Thiotrichales bacterium 19S3-7]|nr:hypothetical protein [Thiotrichales bacterium 19S3-7]MCF6801105.1 hypothetical protein [Thiotrichales bacterium 19S3-11]